MPRLGFTWGVRDNLTLRGGIGLYSGGNPNVWISNAWSNDGISNVQTRLRNDDDGFLTVLDPTCVAGDPDCIVLVDPNTPGFGPPQSLFDIVAQFVVSLCKGRIENGPAGRHLLRQRRRNQQ